MNHARYLIAASALSLSAAALAQAGQPYAAPPVPAPVAEPWQAQPTPAAIPAPVAEPWQAQPTPPRAAAPQGRIVEPSGRGPAIESIDLPPAIEQDVDMIYIDDELVPRAVQEPSGAPTASLDSWSGAPIDMFQSVNPIYTDLRRGLVRYQQRWGNLPQTALPPGPMLKLGSTGDRVGMLRDRLGLAPGAKYDAPLAAAVKDFQAVHGLKPDGAAGAGTIDALNLGAQHFEQLIMINMERAKRLPAPEEQRRYVLVDAGSARLTMIENGRPVGGMKVIVGKAETATPMMAALIKYASVNPYWNVPPELVRNLVGPRVLAQGVGYLTDREYQVLSGWEDDARVLDPHSIDWQAVVDGRQDIRLRRLPSPANSMGMMKFMLPNYFGIYLHDSPEKEHFAKGEQWISNGCVRLEDYKRLAAWLFDGTAPKGRDPKVEEEVNLPQPTPVYMTYLTVQPTATGVTFLPDRYGRDAKLLDRFGSQMVAAIGH